jgi:uncharacterized protein (TIGR00369 family)
MADPVFDASIIAKYVGQMGHSALLGISFHASGDDWCELKLPYSLDLISSETTGIMASGPIFAMMDMAASMAIWLKIGKWQPQATLDMRVDYLRPAKPGRTIYGRGECYSLTRTFGFVRGTAHDGDADRPVAHVAGTFMVTRGA